MNIPNVMLNGVKHLSQGDPSLALRMTRRGTEDDKWKGQRGLKVWPSDDKEGCWAY